MNKKPLVAIEIGSSKVACAVGRPLTNGDGGGFELLGVGVASYPTMRTTWPCETALLAETVGQALEDAKITQPPERAIATLAHPACSHRRVTAHIDVADEPIPLRGRDLRRLHEQAISQALELDRDVFLLEPLGYAGNGFEGVRDPRGLVATRLRGTFQLIGIPLAVRRTLTQALDAVGLELDRLVYGLQAVAASCLEERLWSKRVLLIDVGGCCTEVAILDAGRFSHTLSLPWGGMMVVDAIAKTCRLTLDQALVVSLEGLSSQRPKVRQLVEHELQPLQQQLDRLLKDEVLPDLAIVTGRGALMDGLVEWVAQITHINTLLGRSPRAKGLGDLRRQLAVSPALGLLELAFRTSSSTLAGGQTRVHGVRGSERLLSRLIERTKTLLTEYF